MATGWHNALAQWWFHGESSIPVGAYTVEFKSVTGWTNAIFCRGVMISNGGTATASETYVQQLGLQSLSTLIPMPSTPPGP